MVVDFADDAGLGNAVTVDKDGIPYLSYFIFPAAVKAGEIPITRPIGAPYITTAAANGTGLRERRRRGGGEPLLGRYLDARRGRPGSATYRPA